MARWTWWPAAKNIIVAMMHTNPKGESKLLPECTLPLTGVRCVKKIVTELAVLDVTAKDGFKLLEGLRVYLLKR